jgi:hypothetical protein
MNGFRSLIESLPNFDLYELYFYNKKLGLKINSLVIETELIKRIKNEK